MRSPIPYYPSGLSLWLDSLELLSVYMLI